MEQHSDKNRNPYYRDNPDLRFAVLTSQQEKELFARMKGSDKVTAEEARTFLIENHLLFAQTKAQKLAKNELPADEVISAANEALMMCIDRFDANRGARFSTYLAFYIRRAISQAWQLKDPVNYRGKFPEPEKLDTLNPAPLVEEAVTPDYEGEDFRRAALDVLEKHRSALTKKEQELLRKHYEEGKNFAEIGLEEGVSREMIRVRHDAILKKLRRRVVKAPELQ